MAFEQSFKRRPQQQAQSPRRVRGGIKLKSKTWPPEGLSWIAGAWLRMIEEGAGTQTMEQALEFGERGQTRRIEVLPGRVVAHVQGHKYAACEVTLRVPVFGHEQWEKLIEVMGDQAIYSAKLLAGEIPAGIDALFDAAGVTVLPERFDELTVEHSYAEASGASVYAVTAGLLITEQLMDNPFLAFTLRGMPGDELAERLRQRRSAVASGAKPFHSYAQRLFVTDTTTGGPLEEAADAFWDIGTGIEQIEMTLRKPEVAHMLLRRLGPSPFEGSKFPLVGLLATCYDVISDGAAQDQQWAALPESEAVDDQPHTNTSGRGVQEVQNTHGAPGTQPAGGSADQNHTAGDAGASAPPAAAPVKTAAEVTKAALRARKAAKPRAKPKS